MVRILEDELELDNCPHCGVSKPSLIQRDMFETHSKLGKPSRIWRFYVCSRCGGVVTLSTRKQGSIIDQIFPSPNVIDDSIPELASEYLKQAVASKHAPSGCIMLCASSVDAMLKTKSYTDGTLYNRINQAVANHLITEEMGKWAHEVRLDANDQRHSDANSPLPDIDDATKCVDFVLALAEFLFVLPARVKRGLDKASIKAVEVKNT